MDEALWVDFGEALSIGPRPVLWQPGPTLVSYNCKYGRLEILNSQTHHRRKTRLYILSVWYLKQTICFLISIRIREGRFSLAGFIFFGKEWQTKIRLDPENFKGSIRNRQQIFLCVFLPKPSLQSFEFFSLAIWDLSSPSPCAFLLFPLLVALFYDITFAVLLNMSLLWLLLYQFWASSCSLPL